MSAKSTFENGACEVDFDQKGSRNASCQQYDHDAFCQHYESLLSVSLSGNDLASYLATMFIILHDIASLMRTAN